MSRADAINSLTALVVGIRIPQVVISIIVFVVTLIESFLFKMLTLLVFLLRLRDYTLLFFLVNFPGGLGSHLSAAVSHVTLGSFVFCLITMAHATSTQKNIMVHIGGYQTFCALTILQSFPMRVKSISLYIAGLVTWNRASGTILNHLSSLKCAHQIAGYELTWSSNYHYQLLLRGTKLF